jgi:trimeric autotransporter adhesin
MTTKELPKPALSRREREVAALVADGLTNREIAGRLFISERTVDGHLEHIREKLAVNSRAQVAAWFVSQSHAAAAAVRVHQVRRRPSRAVPAAIAVAAVVVLLLAAGAIALWVRTPSGPTIATVAGSTSGSAGLGLEGGFTGDSGQAIDAQLNRPSDVAVGYGCLASGGLCLYIADTDNSRIRMVYAKGEIITLAGGGQAQYAESGFAPTTNIGKPEAVAIGPDGLPYFWDGGYIARIDSHLQLLTVSSDPIGSMAGLCFGPDGSLYIADSLGNRVWLRKPDGTISPFAGTGEQGFSGDAGPAVSAQLSWPNRLALDKNGNLFIADEGNNRVRRVDRQTGVITTVAGSSATYGYSGDGGPARDAKLSLPEGVAVAANGDIYIADTGNNRVRRVDARTNDITTIAGTGDAGFTGDGGAATQAMLYGPVALALTTSGDLYIVDLGNHRVRLIPGVERT